MAVSYTHLDVYKRQIEDRLKAGMVLTGSEIKSIRNGRVSFNDSYCIFFKGELWVKSLFIGEYANAGYAGPVSYTHLDVYKRQV